MKLFTFTKVASLTVCLISAASLAQAQVISVNFYNNARGADTAYAIDSAAGVANVGNWNNVLGGGGVNTGPGIVNGLLNNSGAATNAYINFQAGSDGVGGFSVWGLGVSSSEILSANSGLYNNYLNYFQNNGIVYIGGLGTEFTSLGYNVIVYFADQDPGWQSYSLTDTNNITDTRYGRTLGGATDANSPFGGFVQSTATSAENATLSNYVVLSGFSGAGFYITGNAESGARPAIAGFQIVAVPEPSTIALAVLGAGAMLVVYRRRRQA